eukprot:4478408-Amphidinium_carterae.1
MRAAITPCPPHPAGAHGTTSAELCCSMHSASCLRHRSGSDCQHTLGCQGLCASGALASTCWSNEVLQAAVEPNDLKTLALNEANEKDPILTAAPSEPLTQDAGRLLYDSSQYCHGVNASACQCCPCRNQRYYNIAFQPG